MMTDINTDIDTGIDTEEDSLKIASFRTTRKTWARFCATSEKLGLTATDVIRSAMEQLETGEFVPTTSSGNALHTTKVGQLTRDDVDTAIHTAISTAIEAQNEVIAVLQEELAAVKKRSMLLSRGSV